MSSKFKFVLMKGCVKSFTKNENVISVTLASYQLYEM